MKIKRNYCDPQFSSLDSIKHVHPFRFPDGHSLGCDSARIYIKIYPCGGITVDEGSQQIGENSKYALVVDLEQGGIKAVEKSHRVIELESELIVKGPVEPRQGQGR
ncbi:MAG: hypothetical protein KAJ19_11790 [Gammaproteobacteria bacterium]|nr:hypothetical protein [Gammaproteobacteria bacterium]